jgi:hypothetical protein
MGAHDPTRDPNQIRVLQKPFRDELVLSIGQHDDFWRHDDANQRDPDDIVTTRRKTGRLPAEQTSGNPTVRPAERRLSSAA